MKSPTDASADLSRALLQVSALALAGTAFVSILAAESKKTSGRKGTTTSRAKAKPKAGSKTSKTAAKPKAKTGTKAGSTRKPRAADKAAAARPKTKPKLKEKPPNSPEQELGDTPVAPWQMPTPEEKAEVRPVRRALKEAVKKVDTPEKADKVVAHLEAAAAGKTAEEVKKTEAPPATPAQAAEEVKQAAEQTTGTEKTEKVIETTARALTAGDSHHKEVVAEAAQEALNPEQEGAPPEVEDEAERELLRKGVLKRLKPLDALDAEGFLLVNHLPHTRILNRMFYGLTMAYSGGGAWFAAMAVTALRSPRLFMPMLREAALPLAITGTLVELPIKWYFKRKRPFISIIQAIVIGKKPGSWSFPSGHSAAAFGGAWLLNQRFPRWSPVTYTLAGLVAFSRIYLGDHYPGDVVSGSLLGLLFARIFRRVMTLGKRR